MALFISIGITLGILSVSYIRGISIPKKGICFLLLLPMFILVAFKDLSVGNDTVNYYRSFIIISRCSSVMEAFKISRLEEGYVLLNYIVSHCGGSYLAFQVIVAAFIFISIGMFIYRYSEDVTFSIFLFFTFRMLFACMVVVRVWLAIAVLLFGFKYLLQNKPLTFFGICLFAASFHRTALVFALLYPLVHSRMEKATRNLYVIFCIAIGFIGKPFFSFLTNKTGYYEGYLASVYFNSTNKLATVLTLLIDVCFFLFFITVERKDRNKPANNKLAIADTTLAYTIINTVFLVCIGIDIIGLRNTIMDRIAVYFRVLLVVMIPYILRRHSIENQLLFKVSIVVLMLIQFIIVLAFRPNWNGVTPYRLYSY